MRGGPPDSAAAAANFSRPRGGVVMAYPRPSALAYFHIFPERFLAGSLEDRRLGQRFGFLRRRNRSIEVALGGGFLGSGKRCRGRGPLITQRAGLLVGGF